MRRSSSPSTKITAWGFPIETAVKWKSRSRARIASRSARVSPPGDSGISLRVRRGRPISSVTWVTTPFATSSVQVSTPAPVSIRSVGRRRAGSDS